MVVEVGIQIPIFNPDHKFSNSTNLGKLTLGVAKAFSFEIISKFYEDWYMNKRLLLITLPISSFLIGVTSSIVAVAGTMEPRYLECFFFRNGQLEITQHCTVSGTSWAGGGFTLLQWDDGTTTRIPFGLQGRGERPCPQLSVNNICG
ncbi:MAG: hypothetical protein ACRCU2_19915, partial [Planktothrix sp.]